MLKTFKSKKGFTLIEAIVVIAILAIIVGIAAPSAKRIIDDGRAVARDNTARSLYVAAQSELESLRANGGLKEFSADFYNPDGSYNTTCCVFGASGMAAPAGEDAQLVRYIHKPRGMVPSANSVMTLLYKSYADPTVIEENSILIEYNIDTGVVLSVFISDKADLQYAAVNENANVSGDRPYTLAAEREQGYCGVGFTGNADEKVYLSTAAIYDGETAPIEGKTNALYACFDVHSTYFTSAGTPFTVMITRADGDAEAPLISCDVVLASSMPQSLYTAMQIPTAGQTMWYDEHATGLSAGYYRVYWLLDYVADNMTITSNGNRSAGVRYRELVEHTITAGGEIRSAIKPTYGSAVVSDASANALYSSKNGAKYVVNTARHLYNVRYLRNGSFVQMKDISLNGISMRPLNYSNGSSATFTGSYQATSRIISDLTMNEGTLAASLFGASSGALIDITLQNCVFSGASNTAALASSNIAGGIVKDCSLTNVAVTANGVAGGIVGENRGSITDCACDELSSVAALQSVAGGVAGTNSGTISDCSSVASSVVAAQNTAGGVVGQNLSGGAITNCDSIACVEAKAAAGGIVGRNEAGANVTECLANTGADVSVTSSDVGGVAGINAGTISKSSSKATVTITYAASLINAGGIAGQNTAGGLLSECRSESPIACYTNAGGIVGANFGRVYGCESRATASGYNQVGGIAGACYDGATIEQSVNFANVSGSGGDGRIGGVVGTNEGDVIYSSNHGTVSGVYRVGGIAGFNALTATVRGQDTSAYCENDGNVTGSDTAVGGIVGENLGSIAYTECRINTLVRVTGASEVGGIAGINGGTITDSVSCFAVTADFCAGGVAGVNDGSISTCYSAGSVSARDSSLVTASGFGGVAGINNGSISTVLCCAQLGGNTNVGGIVGENAASGTVADVEYSSTSYTVYNTDNAINALSGTTSVGGIIGLNDGSLERAVFAAAAPLEPASTTICPIVGDVGTGTATTDLYYLSADDFRLNDGALLGVKINKLAAAGGGTPLNSADLSALGLWSVVAPYPYPVPSVGYQPSYWLETN